MERSTSIASILGIGTNNKSEISTENYCKVSNTLNGSLKILPTCSSIMSYSNRGKRMQRNKKKAERKKRKEALLLYFFFFLPIRYKQKRKK